MMLSDDYAARAQICQPELSTLAEAAAAVAAAFAETREERLTKLLRVMFDLAIRDWGSPRLGHRVGQLGKLSSRVEKIPTDPQHLRGLGRAATNNNQQGDYMSMINGRGGTDGVSIIDSGATVNASGKRSLFTQYRQLPEGKKLYAANGEAMPCAGYGTIEIPSLGLVLRDVYHVPSMGDSTVVSVAQLNKLGYGVSFSGAGFSIRDERTWTHKLVGEGHLVQGEFALDYLKIPLNRAPVSDGTLTLLWRDVWMRWNRFTEFLFQRDETLPR